MLRLSNSLQSWKQPVCWVKFSIRTRTRSRHFLDDQNTTRDATSLRDGHECTNLSLYATCLIIEGPIDFLVRAYTRISIHVISRLHFFSVLHLWIWCAGCAVCTIYKLVNAHVLVNLLLNSLVYKRCIVLMLDKRDNVGG
jgi:hypothetical protein